MAAGHLGGHSARRVRFLIEYPARNDPPRTPRRRNPRCGCRPRGPAAPSRSVVVPAPRPDRGRRAARRAPTQANPRPPRTRRAPPRTLRWCAAGPSLVRSPTQGEVGDGAGRQERVGDERGLKSAHRPAEHPTPRGVPSGQRRAAWDGHAAEPPPTPGQHQPAPRARSPRGGPPPRYQPPESRMPSPPPRLIPPRTPPMQRAPTTPAGRARPFLRRL